MSNETELKEIKNELANISKHLKALVQSQGLQSSNFQYGLSILINQLTPKEDQKEIDKPDLETSLCTWMDVVYNNYQTKEIREQSRQLLKQRMMRWYDQQEEQKR